MPIVKATHRSYGNDGVRVRFPALALNASYIPFVRWAGFVSILTRLFSLSFPRPRGLVKRLDNFMPIGLIKLEPLLLSGNANTFTPDNLPNLVAWYDFNDTSTLWQDTAATTPATSDSDVVGRVDDKSGNGYHITQATTASKPILKLAIQNNKNVLRFDGSDDFLSNTSFPDFGDTFTMVVVASFATAGAADDSQGLVDVATGAANTGFSVRHTAIVQGTNRDAGGVDLLSGSNIRNDSYNLHTLYCDSSDTFYLLNNSSVASAVYTSPNPNTLSAIRVGADYGGRLHWGDIAEIALYSDSKDADERTQVQNAFASKWGITLS